MRLNISWSLSLSSSRYGRAHRTRHHFLSANGEYGRLIHYGSSLVGFI